MVSDNFFQVLEEDLFWDHHLKLEATQALKQYLGGSRGMFWPNIYGSLPVVTVEWLGAALLAILTRQPT